MKIAYTEYRVAVAHDGKSLWSVHADDQGSALDKGAALTVAHRLTRLNIPAYVEWRDVSEWRRENPS